MKLKNKLSESIIRLSAIIMCLGICVFIPCSTITKAENIGSDDNSNTPETVLSDQGYILTHENDCLRLYCATSDEKLGMFAVQNKADGKLWFSNPSDAADDSISLNITDMQSLITITYRDIQSDTMVTLNSKADCVDAGGLVIKKLENGLRFDFTFPSVKIKIPFTVLLNDDESLTAKIEVNKIEEKSEYKLFSVSMLPYFCTASKNENGFILLPDGSGAVMKLNNGKTAYSMYSQPVYGGDAGEITKSNSNILENICMPVFGLQKDESAVFTVISDGAAQSNIHATVSGIESDYNAVWNDFTIRKITDYTLDQGWQGAKTFNVYQETKPTVKTIENTYWFLSGEEASLSGMAKTYRNYLGLEDSVEDNQAKVYVDYLGSVMRKKSVLGFPKNVKMVATSFNEALEITECLVDENVKNLNIRYLEWDKRSVEGRILNKATALSALGGKSNFLKLAKYADKEKIGFFPDVDLLSFSRKSYPFQQYFNATQNMNNEINMYYSYKLNLYTQNTNNASWYIVNYNKLQKLLKTFNNSYKKLGINGLSLSKISNTVTSDYSDKNNIVEPWKGAESYKDIIKNQAKNNTLMLDGAFMQNAIYAKHLVNVPESSDFDMSDYEVPFYQMVISGAVSYSGRAVNLESDKELALLNVMKTGGNLHYSLTYHSENDIVKDTLYDSWIGTDYSKWIPVIKEQYQELNEVYSKLGSNKLVGFEVRDSGLTVSYFEGGGELWVNDSNSAITDKSVKVEAKNYLIRKGRGVS